jgi:hypothetical protein
MATSPRTLLRRFASELRDIALSAQTFGAGKTGQQSEYAPVVRF